MFMHLKARTSFEGLDALVVIFNEHTLGGHHKASIWPRGSYLWSHYLHFWWCDQRDRDWNWIRRCKLKGITNWWKNMKPFYFSRGKGKSRGNEVEPLDVIPRAKQEWMLKKIVKIRLHNRMFNQSILNRLNWYRSCNKREP